ncbi:ATP-dependent helicase [Curtobacterium sp. Leaf183]|uniref:DEAD/DEAH box helicase n=1 Tax=Curtobacterium sp. Leaf183 TaxID=1736291 RepID=UPI0006FA2A7B|nr:DEAD/DEAH box helicase [Curtobacterium sp. Leaf183]KQS08320.1 ATP-dependent helicase [Curtobacterium sp. Leaf183]
MSKPTGIAPALEYHVANTLGWPDLRPLQRAAVAPVYSGADCLLIAPTAGGKTEAATFPLLTRMTEEGWTGLSVVYVAPLKALLNNLLPRLEQYTAWLGRRVALWHGDIGDGARRAILAEPPDILLTTPESLEAMLVSRRVDHRLLFRGLRAVVADEIHSFAAGDRGWHLVAVLERVQRLTEHRIQRVGLSATLGNPRDVLAWYQGSNAALGVPAQVVAVDDPPAPPELVLDHVGSLENAATVISQLHVGEKRLVFCESRRQAEELAFELRGRGVTTFISHSSLSLDERRQSERAFAEARDCVIVSTSTLELGIDIGDLHRMIQLDSPRSVGSFLQRLGRTGRRLGTVRNALFLTTDYDSLLRAAGLLHLWGNRFVEPVIPPPSPRHLAAQQFLALALQEGRFARATWRGWWGGSPVMNAGEEVLEYLVNNDFLVQDSGWLIIGPAAEKTFGGRHFMDLLSTFIADLELSVLIGRKEIGSVTPLSLTYAVMRGEKPLLLAGRAWRVLTIDWARRRVEVEPENARGRVRWSSDSLPESFEMVRARRDVLLGADPPAWLTERATRALAATREFWASRVDPESLVLTRSTNEATLWSMGGLKAHETLAAALPIKFEARSTNEYIRVTVDFDVKVMRAVTLEGVFPYIDARAVDGLKFSAALPADLAYATLAERFVDTVNAAGIASSSIAIVTGGE